MTVETLGRKPRPSSSDGSGTRTRNEARKGRRVDDMSLAAELVREAGTLAAEMLGEGLEIRYKT
jgi:hypothetical protein